MVEGVSETCKFRGAGDKHGEGQAAERGAHW